MADTNTGGSSASVVAIVAIVMLVLVGFFMLRGFGHRGGGGQGSRSNIEISVPRPTAPGK
jgi:LPXTG-motif cell wall-anchored protein